MSDETTQKRKYADYWQVEGVPLVPVFARALGAEDRVPSINTHLWTGFRFTDGSCTYKAIGGINYSNIYDFCGGGLVTSFNVYVASIDHSWIGDEGRRLFGNAPDLADFIDLDSLSYFDQFDLPHAGSAPHFTRSPLSVRVAKLIGASVFARMLLFAGRGNQHLVSFWDRATGPTRKWLDFGREVLKSGVRSDFGYAGQLLFTGAPWGRELRPGEDYGLYLGNEGEYVTNLPYKINIGAQRRNLNSGAQVVAGVISCGPNRRGRKGPLTQITTRNRDQFGPLFCGKHVAYALGVSRIWHGM